MNARLIAGTVSAQIVRGAALVAAVGLAVKALALGKEAVVAAAFGAGAEMDAYLVALAVPAFAITVFPASFATALVPALSAGRGDRPAHAALGVAVAGGAALTIALAILGWPVLRLVGYGFDSARFSLALELYELMVPAFFFACLTATLGAIANSARRFAAPAAIPAVSVVVTVAAVWWGAADWGIHVLAVGLTAGFALETALLAGVLARAGLPWLPSWRGAARQIAGVLAETRPLVLGATLLGGTTLVDQAMASALAPGDVAILGYGTRLGAVVATLGGALAIVCLPYFSSLAAGRDWAGVRRTLLELTALTAAVAAAVAVGLAAASEWLIRVLFERGSFTAADTAAAAWVQVVFAAHIPFYVLANLVLRTIAALGRNAPAAWIALLFFLANAVGDWVLMRLMGVAGIALATAIAYALAAVAGYAWLLREITARRDASRAASPP
jgi:putative peptidoglycan lipid II flippase